VHQQRKECGIIIGKRPVAASTHRCVDGRIVKDAGNGAQWVMVGSVDEIVVGKALVAAWLTLLGARLGIVDDNNGLRQHIDDLDLGDEENVRA
jgi:hypothetical protein